MNRLLPVILAAGIIQTSLAQIPQSAIPTSYSAQQHITRSSSFTDSSNFNSFNFAGNPLGKLNGDSSLVSLNVGYRLYNTSVGGPNDSTGNYSGLVLPVITMRPSPNTIMSFNYSFNNTKANTLTLPLHQFGLMTVSQTKNKVFKGGIVAQGLIAKEKAGNSDNNRALMGIKDAGICIGSEMGPAVNLGVYAHASFFLDTLQNSNSNTILQERYASVKLPQIDVTGDINIPTIKDNASLSFTYAKEHFVYTEKTNDISQVNQMTAFYTIAGNNAPTNLWDADPIIKDSISFNFQNRTSVSLSDNVSLIPSIAFGYMQNTAIRKKPGSDNHPFTYSGEKAGYNWKTSSVRFGIGSSLDLFNTADIWLEYSLSTINLKLGDKYADSLKDSKSKNLNRIGVGTKLNFARIPAFNISNSTDIALTFGYLSEQRNDLVSSYRGETFEHMQPMTINSQLYRYTPWKQFREVTKSSGIQTGLHTSFLDESFATDLYFIYAKESVSGNIARSGTDIEFGVDLIVNVKGKSK